jgi:phosphate/sulfate permease
LPAQFVVVAWFLSPAAALLAAALMRFMRRRS